MPVHPPSIPLAPLKPLTTPHRNSRQPFPPAHHDPHSPGAPIRRTVRPTTRRIRQRRASSRGRKNSALDIQGIEERETDPEARADGFDEDNEDDEEVDRKGHIHVRRFAEFDGHELHRGRRVGRVGGEDNLRGAVDGEGVVDEGFEGFGNAGLHVREGDGRVVRAGLDVFHVAEEGLADEGGVDCGDGRGEVLRLAEGVVLDLARGLDVLRGDARRGRDGDVAVGYVDGDVEDGRGECRGALDVGEVGIGGAVDETVGVVRRVLDGSDEDDGAVVLEGGDRGATNWACGEGSPWPIYVRSVAWNVCVDVVVGQIGDLDITGFVVVAFDIGKIAIFLELVAIGLGYVDVLAQRRRVCEAID